MIKCNSWFLRAMTLQSDSEPQDNPKMQGRTTFKLIFRSTRAAGISGTETAGFMITIGRSEIQSKCAKKTAVCANAQKWHVQVHKGFENKDIFWKVDIFSQIEFILICFQWECRVWDSEWTFRRHIRRYRDQSTKIQTGSIAKVLFDSMYRVTSYTWLYLSSTL